MYKTKVQELCQKRSWSLPEYETTRDGPDHNPRFTAAVTVNGIRYETPSPCRNSKEAQNNAAMLAFEHLSSQQPSVINPSPPPFPPKPRLMLRPKPKPNNIPITGTPTLPGLDSFPQPTLFPGLSSFPQHPSLFAHSAASSAPSPHCTPGINNILPTSKVLPQKLEGGCQISQITVPVTAARDTVTTADRKSMTHLYKNQLQNYAQKQNLPLPVYTSEWEGPPHAMRFKCKVTIDGQTYECPTAFSKLKDAEHAAAEVALLSLLPGGFQEDNSVLYKNLLQELVQKEGFSLPDYNTERFGEAHIPIFISHVEVEGEVFTGQEAKTKKQAEISAAKVAYTTLKERSGEAHIPRFISHEEVEKEVFTGQEAKTKNQAEISAAKVAYSTLKERSSETHIPTFISHVEVEGEVFTGQEAKTKKQAEISAAKVAYTTLKERSGEAHIPTFIPHVEVEGEVFTGQEVKTKKQAEISAAKVAYTTLKERKGKSEQRSLLPLLDHPQKAPEPESLPDCSDSTVQTEFQHHANPNYPVIPGVISSSQPNKKKQCVKVCCNSLTKKIKEKKRRVCANPCTAIPSPEPVVTKKKGSSSASGCANGSMKDSFSSVVKAAAATPSLSDSKNVASNTNNMPSTASSSPGPRKRMVVYSQETNMEVKGGGTLMPISDEKWAAYEYSH
ncbi:double-stranded RNA-binding protein 1-like isoform X2 [Arachis stenosperma]|uniref:double-stranded RNA-binding protein 1-like isoform X2 n=1 Tax=Arachis stenosperma TaxID=217475 RepID=UPI0025ABB74E|nr:double-stranded RNA-binding protein 1-like isoform X2 [Arachis stenosperma]